jgi:hypothetical protein
MTVLINASNTSGLTFTSDTSGNVAIQSNGANVISTAGSNVTFAGTLLNSSGKPILRQTGSVLQVVTTTYSTQVSISSITFTDSGLSLSITPTSATSKILVLVTQAMDVYASGRGDLGMGIRLLRDSTTIWNPSVSGTVSGAGYGGGYVNAGGANQIEVTLQVPITYLDSPATTSAITYKTQGGLYTTANSSVLTFQPSGATNIGKSQITLMEIAA